MPTTLRGLIAFAISSIIMVGVGIFILSRIPPMWRLIVAVPKQ